VKLVSDSELDKSHLTIISVALFEVALIFDGALGLLTVGVVVSLQATRTNANKTAISKVLSPMCFIITPFVSDKN
jgi:hypothetical protein